MRGRSASAWALAAGSQRAMRERCGCCVLVGRSARWNAGESCESVFSSLVARSLQAFREPQRVAARRGGGDHPLGRKRVYGANRNRKAGPCRIRIRGADGAGGQSASAGPLDRRRRPVLDEAGSRWRRPFRGGRCGDRQSGTRIRSCAPGGVAGRGRACRRRCGQAADRLAWARRRGPGCQHRERHVRLHCGCCSMHRGRDAAAVARRTPFSGRYPRRLRSRQQPVAARFGFRGGNATHQRRRGRLRLRAPRLRAGPGAAPTLRGARPDHLGQLVARRPLSRHDARRPASGAAARLHR